MKKKSDLEILEMSERECSTFCLKDDDEQLLRAADLYAARWVEIIAPNLARQNEE